MTRRLIIDTDVGTDVDDLWTLAMIPGRPDVVLEAVTVVYGDTDLRARIAAVALAAMGLDVPVHRGREETLSGKGIMWAGHEGQGIDGLADAVYADGDAIDVLVEHAASEPGTLDVVAIGPLTNIAAAIERDPSFAGNVRHLTAMGGEFVNGWPEHNFSSDARATQVVLDSGADMTIMPLDQTLRVLVHRRDAAALATAHPLGPLLADQAERFWQWLAQLVPAATGDASPAHDPCALLALLEPTLVTVTPMAVEIDRPGTAAGSVVGRADPASSVKVVTDIDVAGMRGALLGALGVRAR